MLSSHETSATRTSPSLPPAGGRDLCGLELRVETCSDEPGKIVITQRQIDHLATGFAKTWQRPPAEQELTGLIQEHVREEVFCREAVAMGMDKDDTVIRRRLRQKMEFVSDDIAAQTEPTEADLNAYLQEHADAFRIEQQFTFQQVYLNPQKRSQSRRRASFDRRTRSHLQRQKTGLNSPWFPGTTGFSARAPWLVAFSFGLMHGLGFAGGLSEAGLPVGHIPTALAFFSLGVEIGHFLFISTVLAVTALIRRIRVTIPRWTELISPYTIGGARCSGFWNGVFPSPLFKS